MDTSSPGAGPRIAGFIVGGIGLLFGIAGYLVWHFAPGDGRRRARASRGPAQPGRRLADRHAAGREVIVEGRIAPDQPVRFRNFVAYMKEEEQRDKKERERTGTGRSWRA